MSAETERCPSCTSEVPSGQRFCGACGSDVSLTSAPTQTSIPRGVAGPEPTPPSPSTTSSFASVGRVTSGDSITDIRFVPGSVLDDRFRIIGLLGKGGMGEVYRADDLKLGQSVALKFLPEELDQDPGRLSRFINEVRVARQVSHANVCRVYDIGEIDGQHFISMEYVDGEDLSSLIRRIGRLSDEKAVQIARQVCAGLAAAHAKGIVHRDLKPANVMVDGTGQVRITDFGLAGLAEAFTGREVRVGTPAYMSPEQLRGQEVTTRSDIYSLGLVLYELFTGRAAFHAKTMAELTRQQQETMPDSPTTVVPGLDPTVETVILRCLDKDPQMRPESALAVAGALPGGDPLAAALAAGETPSPEMVAAAGRTTGLHPGVGIACLALVLVGIAALVATSGAWVWPRKFPDLLPPQALRVQAVELLESLGHGEAPDDALHGFGSDTDYQPWLEAESKSPDRWESLPGVRPSPFIYWYRGSPRPLIPLRATGSASYGNPPMSLSGMTRVGLDPRGRLTGLLVVPPQQAETFAEASTEPDWAALLAMAGVEQQTLTEVEPEWSPLVDCDRRMAWTGEFPDQPGVPIRFEAGAFRGKPVYFELVAPWSRPSRMQQNQGTASGRAANYIVLTLLVLVIVGAILLARMNLKKGRGDKRSALVMALYMMGLILFSWLFGSHHVAAAGEIGLLVNTIQVGLFAAGMAWVCYVALEPYVRRIWPHALISWTRLLAGRFRDPLVGRDLLYGSLAGVWIAGIVVLSQYAPSWLGQPGQGPIGNSLGLLTSSRDVLALLFSVQTNAMVAPIVVMFLILILRVVLRKHWAAVGGAFVVAATVQALGMGGSVAAWIFGAAIWGVLIGVLVRLGILASAFSFIYANLLLSLPLTTDFSAWYAGRAWLGLLLAGALTAYGFYVAVGNRLSIGESLLQD